MTVPDSIQLPADQGVTRVRVRNPLALPIQIAGFDPSEVTISPSSFSIDDQLVTFEATPNSPSRIDIALSYFDPSAGVSKIILPLTLVLYDFRLLPIKFHKLVDIARQAQIIPDQLKQIIEKANHILGRQTNVFIYPIEEDDTILHELVFNEDLGEVLEQGVAFNYGLDKIYQRLEQTSTANNCHHVFTWAAINPEGDKVAGHTWKSSVIPSDRFILSLQVVEGRDLTNSDDLDSCAQTLVHELGHWFILTYIGVADVVLCTSGTEHFEHGRCPDGDHRLFANLMGAGSDDFMITLNQAEVYVGYAPQVEE